MAKTALPGDLQSEIRSLVASLSERITALEAALQASQDQCKALQIENKLLRQKVDALVRRIYGSPKNESIDPKQMELLLAGIDAAPASTQAVQTQDTSLPSKEPVRSTNRKPARSGIPDNLPVEEIHLVPDEVKANPDQFRLIEEVITKELDFEPGRFFVRHIIRGKYVRKQASIQPVILTSSVLTPDSSAKGAQTGVSVIDVNVTSVAAELKVREVFIAPMPNRLIEKGMPGIGLLVYMIVSRFEDHLPFYRLEKIFSQRHQVLIARQTMVDWTQKVVFWLTGIYLLIKEGLVKGNYLQADETPVFYLDRECPGKCRKGYLWVYNRPKGDVLFEWKTGRSHEEPLEFLKEFGGRLQTDGYAVYQTLIKARAKMAQPAPLILYCCWAHARRMFFKAKNEDRRAAWFLRQIGLLYNLERRLRNKNAGPAFREAARMAEAKMILARIVKAMALVSKRVLPQSLLGRAINYAQDLWTELNRYVEDGLVDIDNNSVENSIRPSAIGKKNWLFFGSPESGQDSAVIYTLLGCCHRYNINPAAYLTDVFTKLPDMQQKDLPSLLPSQWIKHHPEAKANPIQ